MIWLEIAIMAGEITGLFFSTWKNGWWGQFIYYTECSNVVLLIAAAVHLSYLLRRKAVPPVVNRLRYIATCLTTVTFLVTVCVLIPWYGHPEFFLLEKNGLFQHLLCPILAVAGLPLLRPVRKKDCLLALLPTLVYGIVFYTLNYFRVILGPYPFLMVHDQPWYMSIIWFAVLAAAAYGTAAGLRLLCGRKIVGRSIRPTAEDFTNQR